jgi:hypothetical protein
MATKKQTKTHTSSRKKAQTSTRKKASALSATSSRSKNAASKATKSAGKSKPAKKKNDELERRRKREELTLKIFRWAYEANQRGEFQRL